MNTQFSTLLIGLPSGMKTNLLIPFEAALRVVTPLIEINDPKRATSIPLFEEWLKDRNQDLTLEQTAWLWENFCARYAMESKKRLTQWAYAPWANDLKNPFQHMAMFLQIFKTMHFRPWRDRMQSSMTGRMLYRLLSALACGVSFFAFVAVFQFVAWALMEAREPLTMLLMLLGLL
jgi:hypothetical protein